MLEDARMSEIVKKYYILQENAIIQRTSNEIKRN